ncbi:MAG: hypothetical protein HOI51_00135 [Nitrosomonadales bacterium]|jgi:hypothetical protein|nr:hypothetical protein [Nitrosomonadales bacterium]
MTKEVFIPELDMSAFRKVGSTNLTNWQAVNELIANSIDSWISESNKDQLEVAITLDSSTLKDSSITIIDNAGGMTKEEIVKCFHLFHSQKSSKKFSDKFLGFYGFGFKGATSKIGNDITIISSENSKVYHQVKANYKLLENGKEKGVTYQEFTHDSASRKLFNGGYKGTKIIITDFNTIIKEEVLLYYLPISWKNFLSTNNLGLPVKLQLNNTKIIAQSFNLSPETIFDLDYDFSWKENGKSHTGTAKGYVGLRFNNLSMATQGINLYRRGQLVKPFEHALYMSKGVAKHNDFNYLIGELDVELSASTTKTGFNTDSPAWEAFITQSKKELKPVVDQIKLKLKNKGSEISSDMTKKDSFVASYRNDLSLDLSTKQKTEIENIKKKKFDSEKIPVIIDKDEVASLIVYSWNSMKIGQQKVTFDFKAMPKKLDDDKLYEVIQISENTINIIFDKQHELGQVIVKAIKNINKNDYAAFVIRSILCEAIQQTFRSRLSPRQLTGIKNQLLGYPLN